MNTNANDCFAVVHATIQGLTRHESDEIFGNIFELVKHEVEDKCDPIVFPEKRKLPNRL